MLSLVICSNSRMSVQDNWLAHLRALVDEEAAAAGGDKRAGFRAFATTTGLNEEYVYQLYEGKPKSDGSRRLVGPGSARKIARHYARGRDHGWIDQPIEPTPPAPVADAEHPKWVNYALQLANLFESMPEGELKLELYGRLQTTIQGYLAKAMLAETRQDHEASEAPAAGQKMRRAKVPSSRA